MILIKGKILSESTKFILAQFIDTKQAIVSKAPKLEQSLFFVFSRGMVSFKSVST